MKNSLITEALNKEIIRESTINRLEKFLNEYDCAMLTAWRSVYQNETDNTFKPNHISHTSKRGNKVVGTEFQSGERFSTEEKKYYNKELQATLIKLGYGVTKVRGVYREEGASEDQEESFFIVNLTKDEDFKEKIFKLSEYYNQDSFLYSPKGTMEGYLIGTNKAEFPGYGVEINSGYFMKNAVSQFMSRIGNKGFVFGDSVEKDSPKTFQDRKDDRLIRGIKIETYQMYSINAKRIITEYANNLNKNLKLW